MKPGILPLSAPVAELDRSFNNSPYNNLGVSPVLDAKDSSDDSDSLPFEEYSSLSIEDALSVLAKNHPYDSQLMQKVIKTLSTEIEEADDVVDDMIYALEIAAQRGDITCVESVIEKYCPRYIPFESLGNLAFIAAKGKHFNIVYYFVANHLPHILPVLEEIILQLFDIGELSRIQLLSAGPQGLVILDELVKRMPGFLSSTFETVLLFLKQTRALNFDSQCYQVLSDIFKSRIELTDKNIENALEWAMDTCANGLFNDIIANRQHCTRKVVPSLRTFQIVVELKDDTNFVRLFALEADKEFFAEQVSKKMRKVFNCVAQEGTPLMLEFLLHHLPYLNNNAVIRDALQPAAMTNNVACFLYLYNQPILEPQQRKEIHRSLCANHKIVLIDALSKNTPFSNALLKLLNTTLEQEEQAYTLAELKLIKEFIRKHRLAQLQDDSLAFMVSKVSLGDPESVLSESATYTPMKNRVSSNDPKEDLGEDPQEDRKNKSKLSSSKTF